jgi:hypothetical protein
MSIEHARTIRTPSPEHQPQNDFERIGDQHGIMVRYIQSLARRGRKQGELERLDPRKFFPKDYTDVRFCPDLYVVEPAVLDDLEAAKKRHDAERVEALRSVIRAMSWTSHGRTDKEVASKKAEDFLRETQAEATNETSGRGKPQTGFEFAHPDLAQWSRVLNVLKGIECNHLEAPTAFVEKKIVQTWKDLIAQFPRKTSKRKDWPSSWPVAVDPPKLSEETAHINERLIALRHVRDQLYYQLLYPKFCMYAQKSNVK